MRGGREREREGKLHGNGRRPSGLYSGGGRERGGEGRGEVGRGEGGGWERQRSTTDTRMAICKSMDV